MAKTLEETTEIIDRLGLAQATMPPRVRVAARYLLDHPNEIGVHSMRQVASAAGVHPNVLVRLARSLGFESYDAFRAPFQQRLLNTGTNFPDRARWLQDLGQKHRHGTLYRDIASTSLQNIEQIFSSTSAEKLAAAATRILKAKVVYVVGVGVSYSLAHYFTYASQSAVDHIIHAPKPGNLLIDDLIKATKNDVVLAMSFTPFRTDITEATSLARDRGAYVIGVTDSHASPLLAVSDYAFVVPNSSPHFFPSMVAAFALLETLNAFLIADAGKEAMNRIDSAHAARLALGIYARDERE